MPADQLELTEQQLFTESGAGGSQCDRILARLERAKGEWVKMPVLSEIGAGGAGRFCMVHSRVADLRKRLMRFGLTIEQRTAPGAKSSRESEYRLTEMTKAEGSLQTATRTEGNT